MVAPALGDANKASNSNSGKKRHEKVFIGLNLIMAKE